ncbi:hypothetical protein SDC9_133804 [bioreactor metagenome]|uniref:Uncharacterized protein n=1 Tax=bioreactor metagenome TaxID=1076179 RepID=A0A645DCS7_9ZZZZ
MFVQQPCRAGDADNGHQQGQRRDAPGLITAQQRSPNAIPRNSGDEREIGERQKGCHIDLDQAAQHGLWAIQQP